MQRRHHCDGRLGRVGLRRIGHPFRDPDAVRGTRRILLNAVYRAIPHRVVLRRCLKLRKTRQRDCPREQVVPLHERANEWTSERWWSIRDDAQMMIASRDSRPSRTTRQRVSFAPPSASRRRDEINNKTEENKGTDQTICLETRGRTRAG